MNALLCVPEAHCDSRIKVTKTGCKEVRSRWGTKEELLQVSRRGSWG